MIKLQVPIRQLLHLGITFYWRFLVPYSLVYHKIFLSVFISKIYFFCCFNACTKAEVDQFWIQIFVDYDILKLYISMGNVSFMQVSQCICKRSNDFLCIFLWSFMSRLKLKIRIKWDSRKEFHDEVNMIVSFNNIPNLNHIWMVKHLKDFNLSSEWFFSGHILDFVFLINFDSNFFIQWFIDGYTNRCICTLSNYLSNKIIFFEI